MRTAGIAGVEFDARAVAAAMKAETSDVDATCDALAGEKPPPNPERPVRGSSP